MPSSLTVAVLVAVLAASPPPTPASRVDYKGPLGLTWGQAMESVRQAVESRGWTLTREKQDDGTFLLDYDGEFGGYKPVVITLVFRDGKFDALGVGSHHDDPVAGARRWQRIVRDMTAAYGKPVKINSPPPRVGEALESTGEPGSVLFEALQQRMVLGALYEGDWKPYASWSFKNRAGCFVALVTRGNPGAGVDVAWLFGSPERVEMESKRAPARRDY